ncbi:MAG: DUF190 domain-containing protein [Solirubrobacterales bacterium]
MSVPGLKITTYFGERDRQGGRFLADRLLDIYEEHGLRASILMRGVEGFGVKHQLRTDRLLTLSEDLPLVVAGVDEVERVQRVAADVQATEFEGLVTLERVQLLAEDKTLHPSAGRERFATKLTLYLGRGLQISGRPAHEAAVGVLRDHDVDGASVLLGVDGTLGGLRRRARFFARNSHVPAMVVSVASAERIERALPALASILGDAVATIERVRVLKRDGRRLASPDAVSPTDVNGLNLWQKLMLFSSEQTHFGEHPVHIEAIRRLRQANAAGATALRGVWGYDGRHAPHGDTFWRLRRQVPTLTVVVDTPANTQRWFSLLDEITPERGLITSEVVPAFRATGPRVEHGGLRLAERWSRG